MLTFPTEINRDFYPFPYPWTFICSGYLPHTNPADRITLVISGSCLLVYPGIVTDWRSRVQCQVSTDGWMDTLIEFNVRALPSRYWVSPCMPNHNKSWVDTDRQCASRTIVSIQWLSMSCDDGTSYITSEMSIFSFVQYQSISHVRLAAGRSGFCCRQKTTNATRDARSDPWCLAGQRCIRSGTDNTLNTPGLIIELGLDRKSVV